MRGSRVAALVALVQGPAEDPQLGQLPPLPGRCQRDRRPSLRVLTGLWDEVLQQFDDRVHHPNRERTDAVPLLAGWLARRCAEPVQGHGPVGRVGVQSAVTDAVDVDELADCGPSLPLPGAGRQEADDLVAERAEGSALRGLPSWGGQEQIEDIGEGTEPGCELFAAVHWFHEAVGTGQSAWVEQALLRDGVPYHVQMIECPGAGLPGSRQSRDEVFGC